MADSVNLRQRMSSFSHPKSEREERTAKLGRYTRVTAVDEERVTVVLSSHECISIMLEQVQVAGICHHSFLLGQQVHTVFECRPGRRRRSQRERGRERSRLEVE